MPDGIKLSSRADLKVRSLFPLTLELAPDCILRMRPTEMGQTLRIGEVARQTGLSIDTIRFYEKQGLSKRPLRTEGGFRIFGPDDVQGLKFVRKAQEMGFSLEEIRELLILKADQVPACSHVKDMLKQKLLGIEQKIQEFHSLKRSLHAALRNCELELGKESRGLGKYSPVLEEISKAACSERVLGR